MEPSTHEPQLQAEMALCRRSGRLNPSAIGWSRRPVHDCRIPGHWLRKKRWNYWCILNPEFLFSATIADLDYAATAFCYVMDFKTGAFTEETVTAPFGRGCVLGDKVTGESVFNADGTDLRFIASERGAALHVEMARFGSASLQADIDVRYPEGQDSLNVVIPWSKRRFQFTSKQHGLAASGVVRFGGREYRFTEADTFASLDFGRGVWPYHTRWNWGGAAGRQDGHLLALNLGGKWTDGTGMTENGFFVDGALTKIGEDLVWEYDSENFRKQWTVRAPVSNRIHVHFMPVHERYAATNALLIQSRVHQLFGYYEGYVIADDGRTVRFSDLQGWAEEHEARW